MHTHPHITLNSSQVWSSAGKLLAVLIQLVTVQQSLNEYFILIYGLFAFFIAAIQRIAMHYAMKMF